MDGHGTEISRFFPTKRIETRIELYTVPQVFQPARIWSGFHRPIPGRIRSAAQVLPHMNFTIPLWAVSFSHCTDESPVAP